MRIDLTSKTALVTGSTAGIGFAVATGLHAAGANVVVNGRGQERVDAAVKRLGGDDRVSGVVADVGTAEGCQALIDAVPAVDILVNNAGIINLQPVFDIPDSEWDRLMAVNLMSGVRLSRHYTPTMVERGWGRVIFVSSESALHIPAEMVHYGVTKIAQLGLARGLAESVPGTGVTVNSVLPGPTHTEAAEGFLKQAFGDVGSLAEAGKMLIEQQRPTSLIRRMAAPEEIANLIVYLASEQSSATTGAALRVDGGVVRAAAG